MGTAALRRRLPAFAAGLATLAMALGSTALPAGAAPPVKDVDLVAVGDSYTAGIGAGDYATSAPCLQTNGGYVNLLIEKLSVVDDSSTNAACASALLDGPPSAVPSVLQQIAALAASSTLSVRTELVTVTAGPNDINFTEPLTTCASTPDACAQAIQEVQAKFPAMQAKLVEALNAIRRAAPHATIAVFGYPLLFESGRPSVLPTAEALELVNAGTEALNSAIAQATNAPRVKAKAVYVDVTEAFKGHATNSEDSWINLDTLNFNSPRNFHPTANGHQAYADALQDAVDLDKLARP